ncbi:MAG: cytochrome C [Flavobacteriales bacterium]|nr:MAG: cytochrome C [Flavobacteriales bacterium]
MKLRLLVGLVALVFLYGCSTKKFIAPIIVKAPIADVTETVSENLIITAETLVEGKNLYTTNCADCHSLYEKESFTAEQWKPIVLRMQKNTRLSDLQREKIYAYLTTPQF